MKNIEVRVMDCGPKWSSIKYVSSNARSRISTQKLILQYKSNSIDVVNHSVLEEHMTEIKPD
jgi:hypothetical protein